MNGTPRGSRVLEIIEGSPCYTPSITFAEISRWCHSNSRPVLEIMEKIENMSDGVIMDSRVSEIAAGKLCFESNKKISGKGREIGLIDCLIASIAEENSLAVITKDRHFMHFDKIAVEMI